MWNILVTVSGVVLVIGAKALPISMNDLKCPRPYEENENTTATIHADPENCSMYYMCANGVLVQRDCPSDLYLNPRLNVCKIHALPIFINIFHVSD